MATTTGTFNFFESFLRDMGNGALDLDTDALGVLLTTSAYTPDSAAHEKVSSITNELSGNGYAREALANVAWTEVGPNGKMMLDSDDPAWTASGGSLVARYWVLYSNAEASDAARELIAWGLIDDTPADVTTTDGNTLTFNVPAAGWFTSAQA